MKSVFPILFMAQAIIPGADIFDPDGWRYRKPKNNRLGEGAGRRGRYHVRNARRRAERRED